MRALATVFRVAAIRSHSIEAIAQSCRCGVSDRKEAAYNALIKDALLTQSVTTIDAIEALTGIDFLTNRQPNTGRSEAVIEEFRAVEMWPR
jgi:hypothetical protein